MLFEDKLFASIDLEFTGFDPETEEILEVGLVLFKFLDGKVEILERWTQVFKPKQEVHLKILALTGIAQHEIDTAPDFSDFRELLSKKLENTVIVGHSVAVDVRFLEKFGVKIPNKRIDTLEIAQWVLPTYHSYNLENLTHTFVGGRDDFHRALADAESTAYLLEKLFAMFRGYSEALKTEAVDFVSRFTYFDWQDLLLMKGYSILAPINTQNHKEVPEVVINKTIDLEKGKSFVFLEGSEDKASGAAGYANSVEGRCLVALENEQLAIQLWKDYGFAIVLAPNRLFNNDLFEENRARNDLLPEEVLFLLKVIAWKHSNWQSYAPVDLNVSFFGSKYLHLVVGGTGVKASNISDKVCASFVTLGYLSDETVFRNYKVICFDFVAFEQFLVDNDANRLSWGYMLSKIRSVYNPETGMGDSRFVKDVEQMVSAVDLFFGITAAVMRKHVSQNRFVSWESLESLPFGFYNLKYAANNLARKLEIFGKKIDSEEFINLSSLIESFFSDNFRRVKWLEYNEGYIILHNQPLEVNGLAHDFFHDEAVVDFVNVSRVESNFGFALSRILGRSVSLQKFEYRSSLNQAAITLFDSKDLEQHLFDLVNKTPTPLVVLFPDITSLKKFYDANYLALKESAQVYAQIYAGGSTKILRNFGLRENTILLVTWDFVVKNKSKKISPVHVIGYGLPEFGLDHPYNLSLSYIWNAQDGNVLEFDKMRMLYQLEQTFEFVNNERLQGFSLFFDKDKCGISHDSLLDLLKDLKFFNEAKNSLSVF